MTSAVPPLVGSLHRAQSVRDAVQNCIARCGPRVLRTLRCGRRGMVNGSGGVRHVVPGNAREEPRNS
jgi:hypothetical protein